MVGGCTLGVLVATGCVVEPGASDSFEVPPTTSFGTDATNATGTSTDSASETEIDSSEGGKLDTPGTGEGGGCQAIDFLFVIDNSASMQTYQLALTDAFPEFITAMYGALPPSIDVHLGLTTTDFDVGCDASEATQNCQSTATLEEVESHYGRPDIANDGGNGTQGRLFEYAGRTYFESTSDEDPTDLGAWFADAAVAAGEEGCSFEMPVAAAAFAVSEANAEANAGFLRDEGALLIVFFLTDEPDKSPESVTTVYGQTILDAKAACGGEACIFVGGLVPACIEGVNQKLWQFMNNFSTEAPQWGDIENTRQYSMVFGDALAGAIAEACASVPIP